MALGAFRLYSYPGLVPYNDEAGELFHLPLFTGLALLAYGLRLRFRFTEPRVVPRIRHPRSWEHAPTAPGL